MAFRNVYPLGPPLRAEKSYTQRHAAEFWMIEPEIAFADLQDDMELAEAMVRFCRERVNTAHLKGILTAPWAKAFTEETPKANEGIRLFAAAKRKIFP
jgi:aspartyl/asparaginyl-tRNA synthetase